MNDFKYQISIIVPFYNTTKYIRKCIDSLLYQTLSSIEIIVVDDCSSENTDEIYTQYSSYENIIFLKNEKQLGPGGARNKGIKEAHGKYIAFCDSDDWVELDTYETAINVMDMYNSEIGLISMQRIYDHPTSSPNYICHYDKIYQLNSDVALKILFDQYDMGISIPFHCTNKIYRRDFLNHIHAYFEEKIFFQGKLFTIYTFLQAKRIVCIPNAVYKHYRRMNSVIQSFDEKHINDFYQSMIILKDYLLQMNKYDIYRFNYYALCEKSLDIVVKEIFEFVNDENQKKLYLHKAIESMKSLVSIEEYFEYADAEKIRQHIQPHITNTALL